MGTRRRRGAWLVEAGVQLWREPAIEPPWLQYLLLLLLPAAVGLGFAVIAQRFRASPVAPPSQDPSTEGGVR
ncbi:hypothetical protein [Microbacterium sp. NPDC090003]|uniref:hypothetical protein n=1 Tax=Microbacterium sp. NPDC090003 TaxID=3364203 RepID=UPI0038091BE6